VVLGYLFDPIDASVQHRRAFAQLLVEQCADLFRFLKSKESAYQKAVVSICGGDEDESQLKRLLVLSCLDEDSEVLSEQQFKRARESVRGRLHARALAVMGSIASAMSRQRALKQRLGGKIPAAWLTPIAAMKGHLEHLCSDVLANTPADRLIDLDRYLQAIEMRLEKLQSRLLLDAQWQKEVDEIESGLKALWSTYPEDWQYQDPKLVDLRWQIEEFQVLCFAQSLKTRDKVSFKRLSTALRDYREL
jgi:ATP-dependent helicase HrpA